MNPWDSFLMPFPDPGTTAWGQMNQRRAELIRKKILGSLSSLEHHELDYLQEMSARAIDSHPLAYMPPEYAS